ncbi:MAG: hypothetical protein IT428_10485 [Planctomycetaceae bacterium]|nr:hypothetical protein [Planctomycetaceae bacterium]
MALKANDGKGNRRQALLDQAAKMRARKTVSKGGDEIPFEDAVQSLNRSLEDVWRNDPCLAAYRALQRDIGGGSEQPGIETIRLFDELHRMHPGQHFALHHLAVLSHGGAIQDHLQSRSVSPETMTKWRQGLQHWSELVGSDTFWKGLAGRWETRRRAAVADPLLDRLLRVEPGEVRRTIPGQLLEIHSRIVSDFLDVGQLASAREHWIVLRDAPFDAALVEHWRKKTFDEIVGRLSAGSPPEEHPKYRDRCRWFLELEEGYLPALHALCRSANGEAQHWLNADVDQPAKAMSALASVSREARHPVLEGAAPGNLAIEGCLYDYHATCVEAALRSEAARKDDSSQARIPALCEALRSARTARRFGNRSRADGLVGAVIHRVSELFQASGSSVQFLGGFLDSALPNDPEFAALNALRALQLAASGNARKGREHLENARRQLNAERDEVSAQLVEQFSTMLG